MSTNWRDDDDNPQKSQKAKRIVRRAKESKLRKKRSEDMSFLNKKDNKKQDNWMN